jgi:hypothetical protein
MREQGGERLRGSAGMAKISVQQGGQSTDRLNRNEEEASTIARFSVPNGLEHRNAP